MKKNGSPVERRLAFLEKVYLEDRERWAKNDRTLVTMLQAIQAQNGEIKRQNDEVKRQGERIDFAMKALHRLMEQGP